MNGSKWKKYGYTVLFYFFLAIAFKLIGGEQLKNIKTETGWTDSKGVLPEFTDGQTLQQPFMIEADIIDSVEFMVATYARENQGYINLALIDVKTGVVLATQELDIKTLPDNTIYIWGLEQPVEGVKGRELSLQMESFGEQGESITFYYGTAEDGENKLILNGAPFSGRLYLVIHGEKHSLFGMKYWLWVMLLGAFIIAYMAWTDYQDSKGKITKGKLVFIIWNKYNFLIKQLVARDFKTKYKRSVLGYLWSFLNPLLTMLVQYVVFSTIFKNGIDNYPVYLLSGIIIFNFFSEAVGQGLGSIVYNASLITKVYVPKYIYPVTKVASTSINLFISIIPLLLVTLLTGVRITPAILFYHLCWPACCCSVWEWY